MRLQFDQPKTTQAAAVLLELSGGRMSYLRLIKLLYMADREALAAWGMPITGARYVSMRHGPVLSEVLDLIKHPHGGDFWSEHIRKDEFDVVLEKNPGDGFLCDADVELLGTIFNDCKGLSRWRIVDVTHKMPEWENPGHGAKPITPEKILEAKGLSKEEIDQIMADLHHHAWVRARLGVQ